MKSNIIKIVFILLALTQQIQSIDPENWIATNITPNFNLDKQLNDYYGMWAYDYVILQSGYTATMNIDKNDSNVYIQVIDKSGSQKCRFNTGINTDFSKYTISETNKENEIFFATGAMYVKFGFLNIEDCSFSRGMDSYQELTDFSASGISAKYTENIIYFVTNKCCYSSLKYHKLDLKDQSTYKYEFLGMSKFYMRGHQQFTLQVHNGDYWVYAYSDKNMVYYANHEQEILNPENYEHIYSQYTSSHNLIKNDSYKVPNSANTAFVSGDNLAIQSYINIYIYNNENKEMVCQNVVYSFFFSQYSLMHGILNSEIGWVKFDGLESQIILYNLNNCQLIKDQSGSIVQYKIQNLQRSYVYQNQNTDSKNYQLIIQSSKQKNQETQYNQVYKIDLDICVDGWFYNMFSKQCEQCDSNCATCDIVSNRCVTCEEGFYLFNKDKTCQKQNIQMRTLDSEP